MHRSGATCIALATPLTALFEPVLARRRFSRRELLLGLSMLPGVALVAGGVPIEMSLGIGIGIVSALFGTLNKHLVEHADPLAVTAIELGAGTLALTLLAPLMPTLLPELSGNLFVLPDLQDAFLLLLLAVVCTLLPFTLSLIALRHMSAFSAQRVTNLEPVYAIVLAALLLGEQYELKLTFYAGAAVIVGVVFAHPLLNRTRRIRHPELLATAEAKNIAE